MHVFYTIILLILTLNIVQKGAWKVFNEAYLVCDLRGMMLLKKSMWMILRKLNMLFEGVLAG